jgi:hypothetical protein
MECTTVPVPAEMKSARTVDKFKCAYRLFLQLCNRRRRGTKPEISKATPETTDGQRPPKDPDGSPRTAQQVSQVSILFG